MSWIAPFKPAIEAQVHNLAQHGFSFIGEDEVRFKFTDGEILITFSVERYDDWLNVWIRYLGDQAGDDLYRLDTVMQVLDGASPQNFGASSPEERDRLVGRYVDYVIQNKARLFGPVCPYAEAYKEFNRVEMEKLMAQWSRKP